MKIYTIDTKEIFTGTLEVQANNKEEAEENFWKQYAGRLEQESEGIKIVDMWEQQASGAFINVKYK